MEKKEAPDPNQTSTTGYELIGQVAQNSQVPTDEMIGFVLDILKKEGRQPQDLTLEELKLALIQYISKLD